MLGAREEYLCHAKKSALELKAYLSKLSKILEKDISRKKEMLEYADDAGLTKEEIQKEKEEIKFLESVYPVQLYRQLSRWIKAQEKSKSGSRKRRRRRSNN